MSYTAPVKDMLFNMQHLAGLEEIAKIPGFEEAGMETAQAVLEECARFNQDVLAPLNWEGDKNPSSWKDGVVTTTAGFKQAYQQYAEGGWHGLQHPAEFGGPGPVSYPPLTLPTKRGVSNLVVSVSVQQQHEIEVTI